MFTGLVQATGQLQRRSGGLTLQIPPGSDLDPAQLALGDSVAVDGVCLTVTERSASGFRADVSEETLSRTTLSAKADRGGWVNLEPALRLQDRLGGHLVSGHVDGLGHVVAVEQQSASWTLRLRWEDPAFGRYICEKASIAVDGISLTVARLEGQEATAAIIPHTAEHTTVTRRPLNSLVNVESDLIGKYVRRVLGQLTGDTRANLGALFDDEEALS